ncbi:IS630 transposase-related protein [Symbiopectobacterium purcellii]|uniref:IS630 transposase-related protein n=1 Tax=Symbiopectobacterium purcellii TaxID=2871826 RepID=UPI003F851ACC
MSYSIDFRRKVISTRKNEGLSIRETAKQFRIGPASVSRWINQIESKASTTRQRKIDKSELIKDVEQYPDAYQKERAERFGVCQKAIWQALKKLGLTYKKNSIANRLKNDYILCPDMRQRSIAGCYQNNVAWLYLPTYSPDLNPIEHKWAQAKSKKQKKRDGLRYREFVLSPYGVIKIKSLGYTSSESRRKRPAGISTKKTTV